MPRRLSAMSPKSQVERLRGELNDALERQTASAEILASIRNAWADPRPVFETILRNLLRLFGSRYAIVVLVRNDMLELVGIQGEPGFEKMALGYPRKLDGSTFVGRAILAGHAMQVVPVVGNPEATPRTEQWGREFGFNSLISVPLIQQGKVIGGISTAHRNPIPFTDKQVALIKSFADQAVIAVENTRLLNELRESLKQQSATADVLKVISRSAFELQTVLDTLTTSAVELCQADKGAIFLRDGQLYRIAAIHGFSPDARQYALDHPIPAGRGTLVGRVALSGRINQIPDVLADTEYQGAGFQKAFGFRTNLGVPLLRDGATVGVFSMTCDEVRPFNDKQIELVATFADQAVIAIENARLLGELRQRTSALSESLENLRTAQDRLIQTEKLASLGQLTAGIAHEIKNPLNFVNNFSALSVELIDELTGVLTQERLTDKGREETGELTALLKDNLSKVVQHGKRADSIVKNMLQHSREGSGERRSADINALVGESLNLAYHGARAENAGFTITLRHDLDPEVGALDLYPQEMTRALLNLISNGFYAATKRKTDAASGNFEPVLSAATRNLGDTVEIRVRDNGSGISPEVRDKMFNPFFTTKPTGEGTGLGLSMTHDIIVKQHGGRIDVKTEPGAFTEFIITLPREKRAGG